MLSLLLAGGREGGRGQERKEDAKHLLGPWLQAPNLEMVQRTVKCAQSDRRLSGQSLPGVGQKLGHSNLFLVAASPPRRPASKPSLMQEIEDFGHLPKTAISISAIIAALLTLPSFDWRLRRLLLPLFFVLFQFILLAKTRGISSAPCQAAFCSIACRTLLHQFSRISPLHFP